MGRYTDLRVEFVRRILGSEYRLDPNDAQNSRKFISRLSTDEHRLTFSTEPPSVTSIWTE